jgi:anti-anti-sigma factor
MSSALIELYSSGDDSIITLHDESLDIENYSIISQKLRESLGGLHGRRIVFDLSSIKIIDSAGIGLLAMIRNISLQKGMDVVIACEDLYMYKIIEILNAAHSFMIYTSVAHAIKQKF